MTDNQYKIPNDDDVSPADIQQGTNLINADFSDAKLLHADLSAATLTKVDFSDASLCNVDFSDTELTEADFSNADLRHADLSGANLFGADLSDASLVGADLTSANLYQADLSGTDRRETTVDSVEINMGTKLGRQTRGEQTATGSANWDQIARAYNNFKMVCHRNGLINKARTRHFLERRARGYELKQTTALNPWVTARWLGSVLSRIFIGYGVRVRRLFGWMAGLFVASTVIYYQYEVAGSTLIENVSYSIRAFTVAPPFAPDPLPAHGAMMIETFFGTLFIVLLGYVLSNREF